jgi:hypothetical protein
MNLQKGLDFVQQDNIDRLMMAHFQTGVVTNPVTNQSHEISGPVN